VVRPTALQPACRHLAAARCGSRVAGCALQVARCRLTNTAILFQTMTVSRSTSRTRARCSQRTWDRRHPRLHARARAGPGMLRSPADPEGGTKARHVPKELRAISTSGRAGPACPAERVPRRARSRRCARCSPCLHPSAITHELLRRLGRPWRCSSTPRFSRSAPEPSSPRQTLTLVRPICPRDGEFAQWAGAAY